MFLVFVMLCVTTCYLDVVSVQQRGSLFFLSHVKLLLQERIFFSISSALEQFFESLSYLAPREFFVG